MTTTAKAAHTPGPWKASGPIASNPEIQINSAPMTTVATVTNPREHLTDFTQEECEANARLMAAAPEMLKALEHIEPSLFNPFEPDNQSAAYLIVKAAIQKAKGGQ